LTTTARDDYSSLSVSNDMTEEKTPKIDFKVLDEAVKKVLAFKTKRKAKAVTSEKKGV
jgi:phosphoribosyl-ATP pyrophosphohydrolase